MLTRDGKEGKEEEEEGLRVLGMDDQEEPACEETKDGTGEEYYDAMDEEEDEDEAAAARQGTCTGDVRPLEQNKMLSNLLLMPMTANRKQKS